MQLRVGPQLKPISSYRRVRWRGGAPTFWGIADQGGTLIDASDNRQVCTNHGGVTGAAGVRGPALSFDGSGYVDAGNARVTAGDFTASLFIRAANVVGTKQLWQQSSSGWMQLRLLDNEFQCSVDGSTLLTASQTLDAVNWWHLAATLRGTTLAVYVNGALGGTTTQTPVYTNNQSLIGALSAGAGSKYVGQLDDFRLYPRALTAGEILSIYLDPWWRLRKKRPWWMEAPGSGAAVITLPQLWAIRAARLPARTPRVSLGASSAANPALRPQRSLLIARRPVAPGTSPRPSSLWSRVASLIAGNVLGPVIGNRIFGRR